MPEKPEPVTNYFSVQKYRAKVVTTPRASGTHERTIIQPSILIIMKTRSFPAACAVFTLILGSLIPTPAQAATPALIDDFSAPEHTTGGAGRLIVDDQGAGSQSHAIQRCEGGILKVEGELIPGRGAPAFISVPLLLASAGQAQDVSAYTGVRLRVKLVQGPLSVQVSSTDVQNFDYHSAIVVGKRGEFVEVRLPFKDLKRAWSEQTALNPKTVTSVNLVAFGMAKTPFAYEVDEIGFY